MTLKVTVIIEYFNLSVFSEWYKENTYEWIETYVGTFNIEIMTLTFKGESYKKACKNTNISEAGLDTHMLAIIYRWEFVYALSFGILTFVLDRPTRSQ